MPAEIPFYRHNLAASEARSVARTIGSRFLTTGPQGLRLEKRLAEYLGVPNAVAVSSCTSALFLSLRALGIGPGDHVLTSPMSFIASANAILHCGAEPVFVDVDADTGCIALDSLEAAITSRTRAVLPVHLYGQMVDMRRLRGMADQHGLAIVEDAAHALESARDGVRPGTLADCACFSFYATKSITSGEGGCIVTRDGQLAERLRRLRLHGMSKDAYRRYEGSYQHWDMEELGYKANMSDLQAALLLPQIPAIERRLRARERICAVYDDGFGDLPGVRLPGVLRSPRSRHARHLYTIWVDPDRRDEILHGLNERGVGVAVNFRAIHTLSYYRKRHEYRPGTFPEAERIGASTISLPLYPQLTLKEARRVVCAVRETVEEARGR